ncbi:MAG: flippase-like domain-containing protein, partial [Bacteroidales bacterium]
TSIILVGVFIAPQGVKKLLVALFSIPFLQKWRTGAAKTGDEIIITSKELKGKSFYYWFQAAFATFLSWTARFWVLNCLILALNPDMPFHFGQQITIYAKQLVMWVILLISPTPGASGVAEISFAAFFGNEFPANLQAAVALLWRAISYYPYLFIGLIVLPIWLRKLRIKKIKRYQNEDETQCKH